MQINFLRREGVPGGQFCAQDPFVGVDYETPFLEEVRLGEVPDELWEEAMTVGLPMDEDGTNDSTWLPYWETAQVVWTHTEGEVHGVSSQHQ